MKYDIVLIEKPCGDGVSKEENRELLALLGENESYPIEINNKSNDSSAMGFIGCCAANTIDYDYEASGLNDFIEDILSDMNKESPDNTYTFKNLVIYLTRDILDDTGTVNGNTIMAMLVNLVKRHGWSDTIALQVRAGWTTACIMWGFEVDTELYDRNLIQLYNDIYARASEKSKTKSILASYEKFNAFMCRDLV